MTCPECGSTAWVVVADNGVVDPADGTRIEYCQCECGHEFRKVLQA